MLKKLRKVCNFCNSFVALYLKSSKMETKAKKPTESKTEMSIPEFLNFRTIAYKKRINFDCHFENGKYVVEAPEQFMLQLGF